MAYVSFNMSDLRNGLAPIFHRDIPTDRLEDLERKAVMLAQFDAVSSLADAGFRYKLGEFFFGRDPVNTLADPSLEALRSFGVAVANDRSDLARREEETLISLGFSAVKIEEARNLAMTYHRH